MAAPACLEVLHCAWGKVLLVWGVLKDPSNLSSFKNYHLWRFV